MQHAIEVPSSHRQAIVAEADMQRLERRLTTLLAPLIDEVSRTYLRDLCELLIKKHKQRSPDDKRPAYCIIDNRLQHLLDYIYIDFEKALEGEVKKQYGKDIVVLVGRDFGTVKSTKITLVDP